MPARSATGTPVVMTSTAVCTAVRRTNRMHATSDRMSWMVSTASLPAEADVVQRAPRAFLGSAGRHHLEFCSDARRAPASLRGGVMVASLCWRKRAWMRLVQRAG
jgi:hypothetical protein